MVHLRFNLVSFLSPLVTLMLICMTVFIVEALTRRNVTVSVSCAIIFIPNIDGLAPPPHRVNLIPFSSHGKLLVLTPLFV
jgi:hypothetical protein